VVTMPPLKGFCLLTDVLAAKLRVTDEAARKGRQHDPGLPFQGCAYPMG
jgi:hypothetical protein